MARKELNLHRDSEDSIGRMLCPLRFYHFGFGKKQFGSVESFMLSFRVHERDPMYFKVSMGTAMEARRFALKHAAPESVMWNGRELSIRGERFRDLFTDMLRCRFRHDAHAVSALWASGNAEFVHEAPRKHDPVSVVPIELYCETLMEFRREVRTRIKIAKPARTW